MTQIPFLDVAAANAAVADPLRAAFERVLGGSTLVLGAEVEAFERAFAAHVGAAHCVGVGNGYDALHLGLRALGVGVGDEVLVPTNTYVATWLAVSAVGARPVGVEPDPRTYNLDPEHLDAAVGPRTKAVIPVHLYGQPADMTRIGRWADERGMAVLADAAQAHGSGHHGHPVGAFGRLSAWSFYPTKNLGALGDGGAVTTDDPELDRRLRALRSYGESTPGVNDHLGCNSRLDELQAAFLRVKLAGLDDANARRRLLAERYLTELADLGPALPVIADHATPVWHQFVLRSPHRSLLRERLHAAGVQTMIHYPVPPPAQPAYAGNHDAAAFPLARRLADEVLSLPIGPPLTDDQQEVVIEALRAAWPADRA